MGTSRAVLNTPYISQPHSSFCDSDISVSEPTTILVVEDHELVRAVVREMLESCGYHVLSAQDGLEALGIVTDYHGPLHLLLTDLVLPFLNGPQLSERTMALRPRLKTLYMSGYPETSLRGFGVCPALPYLQKPFTSHQLIEKVQEALCPPTNGPPYPPLKADGSLFFPLEQ